jgi:hypothetical protein
VRWTLLLLAVLLAGCGSSPPAPDWQLNASQALQAFQADYLKGDTAASERDFVRARSELARTGRADLVARAELVRCAVRAASLEFDDCPGFQALRDGAGVPETAYADYLAGKGSHQASDDPLSRLVAAAVKLKNGGIDPAAIAGAIDMASAQGWLRPLLAWLGLQAKRAEDAGDGETAARLRRRMALISG